MAVSTREKPEQRARAAVKKKSPPAKSNGHLKEKLNGHAVSLESGELEIITMDKIERVRLIAVLPGLLYRGKMTMLAGVPGDGKSALSLDLVARMSAGKPWPVGDGRFEAADVVLLTAEDDPNDTIAPRLDLAGADSSRVHLIQGTSNYDPVTGAKSLDIVSLANDLGAIERTIKKTKAGMFVIDPLTSFADSDTNKTVDMRRLLDGLKKVAERTEAVFLIDTHFNKRSDAKTAMQMIAGNHVIIAAPRIVLVTARDPSDLARRLILPVKLNVGSDQMGFAFRLVGKEHEVCGDIVTVEWESKHETKLRANDVLVDSTPRALAAVAKTDEIRAWARELLKDGKPVASEVLMKQAKEQGFTEKRVRATLKDIGALASPGKFGSKWQYQLRKAKF
jgi:KaiC/GvpD/RAD55 family RecA-like ATPase